MRLAFTLLLGALLATCPLLSATSHAGHHEEAVESMTDKAKRAGTKGAQTGTDSMLQGNTMEDSAKKGGAAAVDEAIKSSTPSMPSIPEVSAPAAE